MSYEYQIDFFVGLNAVISKSRGLCDVWKGKCRLIFFIWIIQL